MAGHGGGAWKVAYADFVTAMMAFFMVMWLLSQKEDVKEAVAQHFRNPGGKFLSGNSLIPPKHPQYFKQQSQHGVGEAPPPVNPESETARKPYTLALQRGGRAHVGTALFFPDGRETLDEAARQRLSAFALFVRGKPHKMEIRGHASRRPPGQGGAQDPWQLSYQRCVNTMRELEQLGIPLRQMRLSQAGDSEPYTIGNEPDRVARNARVEVFLLNEVAEEAMGTPEERERRYATPPGE